MLKEFRREAPSQRGIFKGGVDVTQVSWDNAVGCSSRDDAAIDFLWRTPQSAAVTHDAFRWVRLPPKLLIFLAILTSI